MYNVMKVADNSWDCVACCFSWVLSLVQVLLQVVFVILFMWLCEF